MKYKSPEYITTYLYSKDPDTWDVIGYPTGGAAMLKYLPEGTEFHFMLTAVGLTPGQNYSLIYYPDPWPGNGLICLGSGTACSQASCEGKLHMQTANPSAGNYVTPMDTGDLPSGGDANAGAKIWLVRSEDVDCSAQQMTDWNPLNYLFENCLIYFADTDD